MNLLDVAIVAVVLVSTLIGVYRGFIRETLSLIAWILAFWVAFTYAETFSSMLSSYVSSSTLRVAASFLVLFVVTVIVFSLIAFLLGRLFGGSAIRGTDRVLGGFFGVLRAVVIVGAFILAAGLTSLPDAPWWRESVLARHMKPVVVLIQELLPNDVARQLQPPA
ncbi:MAG: CvpA family protein [Gammaproteobacteria bacterium]|nr:CvpA family protein [Gammaproteobacteria bacterium]